MCGIAGAIALNTISNIKEAVIVEMCDSIKHFDHNRAFQLGHRRLSIIDLSTNAGQPMVDPTGRYILVFNGEIYNHQELRGDLEKSGVKFRTSHSDSEVLLNGLITHGKSFIDRLNGMFAFCFMDLEQDYSLFVRDRLGIKPLYYSVINGTLYFASEVKALRKVPGFNTEFDKTALFDYLVFSSVKAPKTLFSETYKLQPGHLFEMKSGEISKQISYWDLKNIPKRTSNFNTEKEGLLAHFDNAAKIRMIADVKVGVLLSGGVDSTANLATLSKYSDTSISAFSIGFKNEKGYTNEFKYAQLAADRYNANYHEIEITHDDYVKDLTHTIQFQDMPIADTANPMIYRIAKKAREEGITVLLGGEGSDELLIGYSHWSLAAGYQSLLNESKAKAKILSAVHSLPYINRKRQVYREWYPKTKMGYTHFAGGTEVRSVASARMLMSKDIQKELEGYSPLDEIQKMYNVFRENDEFDYFDWMTYVDLNYRLPELLLARLDRMTMGASIEGRVPFLDHNFVEYCFSMSNEYKFKDNIEKYILKKSFEGLLPNEILYRPKEGFLLPLNQIIMSNKDELNANLLSANKQFGIYTDDLKLSEHYSSRQNYNLINLSIWSNQL
jgi:asparagine synthase (glutamine-hydrolysing)